MSTPERFDFAFAAAYRLPALLVGVLPATAYVEVGPVELRVRFGPWSLRTALTNIHGAQITGGYAFLKTAGPPHLSFADRGVTFATNGESGLCLQLRQPVAGIDPTGTLKHPGVTLTVARPRALQVALGL